MKVVKLMTDDDGCDRYDRSWHYVFETGGSPTLFCSMEVFGPGEGDAKYKTKKGKVTCKDCLYLMRKVALDFVENNS